jgi:hypothetical protein
MRVILVNRYWTRREPAFTLVDNNAALDGNQQHAVRNSQTHHGIAASELLRHRPKHYWPRRVAADVRERHCTKPCGRCLFGTCAVHDQPVDPAPEWRNHLSLTSGDGKEQKRE